MGPERCEPHRPGGRLALPGVRIAVVGTTGAGKSTLAARLAGALGCPHIELDALYWGPGWQPFPEGRVRAALERATRAPRWVTDGNYGQLRDLTWARADTLVWLDYPLPLVLWRLLMRSLRRSLGGVHLWNGNRERLLPQLLSRESLFLWALKTAPRHRRSYPRLLGAEHAHLRLVRLRAPYEAGRWLAAVRAGRAGGC